MFESVDNEYCMDEDLPNSTKAYKLFSEGKLTSFHRSKPEGTRSEDIMQGILGNVSIKIRCRTKKIVSGDRYVLYLLKSL
jgi:hypothetical protein